MATTTEGRYITVDRYTYGKIGTAIYLHPWALSFLNIIVDQIWLKATIFGLLMSDILSSGESNEVKLQVLVEDIDTVILAADSNNNIMILYSPQNRRHKVPSQKQSCMHARHRFSSDLHPFGFENSFQGHRTHRSDSSRPIRMQASQRSSQHSSTRRRRSRWF